MTITTTNTNTTASDDDVEALVDEQERGGRIVGASVAWDTNGLDPKQWGSDADPWRERIARDHLGPTERAIGVTTGEVLERLGVEITQAAKIRIALCLRALGWRPGAQPRLHGERGPRRYKPGPTESAQSLSPHGQFPGIASPPGGGVAPNNSGPDPRDPRTWRVASKGVGDQPDWVVDPSTRQVVRRPIVIEPPSSRVHWLTRRRHELAGELAAVDAELQRLQGGRVR